MTGIIYRAICSVTGKVYIGQTIQTLKTRRKQHIFYSKDRPNIHFYNAINKYGQQSFEWDILEECPKEKLSEREIFYIELYDSYKNGYNSTPGGELSPFALPEIQAKIKENGWPAPWTGKEHLKETKLKMSVSHKGMIFSDEHKKNIRQSKLGIKRPDIVGDKNPANNRNNQIKRIKSRNKEYPGAYKHYIRKDGTQMWRCKIGYNGKRNNLGTHESKEIASIVYKSVFEKIWGVPYDSEEIK